MKLKLVERSSETRTSIPKLSVSQKGAIYINRKSMELMNIGEGKRMSLFQDENEKQNWYINISESGYIKVAPKSNTSDKDKSATVYIPDICKKLIDTFYHIGKNSLKFKLLSSIEFEGKKYYPLELIKESLKMDIPNPNGK